jgi:hypothetical protein
MARVPTVQNRFLPGQDRRWNDFFGHEESLLAAEVPPAHYICNIHRMR